MFSSDELVKLAVEASTGFAIFALDAAGRIVTWNAGAERLLGYTNQEIIGSHGEIIFTPEDRSAGIPQSELEQAATNGRAEDERWHVRKDSSRFWGSGLLMRVPNQPSFIKIMRDQTDKHRTEELLKASEARFRTLATAIPQLVFTCRGDGDRTWGSPQWIIYTGLVEAESLAFGWLQAVHPEDRDRTVHAWGNARNNRCYDVQHRIRRAAGDQYRWHQTRATPLNIEEPAASEWVGTSTDIHDLKALQHSQEVLLAELQHRTRNLLSMVSSVARRSARSAVDLKQFLADFDGRLHALSRAESLLPVSQQGKIELRTLVEMELAAHRDGQHDPDKVRITGERVDVPANTAQLLALALHELATNAAKHGALRYASGRLHIAWTLHTEHNGNHLLELTWREMDVPVAPAPGRRRGYGSELLQTALPYQFGATTSLELTSEGVVCRITVPAATLHVD